jgi:disease resistance protein RPM1
MAEAVVSLLLSKLGTLLTEEYKLIEGLQREVPYIRDELGSMRAFLRIAEAKQDAGVLDDEQKEWFKQVLEVAYDTEDAVDEFLLRFAQGNVAGFSGHVRHMYTSIKNLPSRHQISSKIRHQV